MAESQSNGSTILLGPKRYEVEQVGRENKGIIAWVRAAREKNPECPRCGSRKLYRHGLARRRRVLHSWSYGDKVYLELESHRWRCRERSRSFNAERDLLRPYSRITRQAEAEALWQLRDRSFSQVTKELGVGYNAPRRLLQKEIDEETLGFVQDEDEIHLDIDEHSFKHQELVHTVTEVKQRNVLGILRDDRIATLKKLLAKIPRDKVKEVCIDMKEGLRKAVEAAFPLAGVVVDPFHVTADSNKRMDEARRIEKDVHRKRQVQTPKKIFLVGREKLSEEKEQKVDKLLDNYPGLKGFYWAKEKIRELYRQSSRGEATKLLENIIFNLKSADDAELIRWANTLKM